MSEVVGSRKKLKSKLKLLVGRAKAAKDNDKSVNTRTQERKKIWKEKSSKYERDDPECTHGPWKRESRKRFSDSRQFASDQEVCRKEVDGKTHLTSSHSIKKRKSYAQQDLNGRKSGSYHSIGENSTKGTSRSVKAVQAGKSKILQLPIRKLSSLKGRKDLEYVSTSELNLKKHADKRPNKHQYGYPDDFSKKKPSRKNGLDNASMLKEDLPRKRKKIFRRDPHDKSNKRLDDGISMTEASKEKNIEKSIEASKNAQFRAIQPSPAILKFVEDNLLGRRRLIELRRSGYDIKLSAPLDNKPFSTSLEREKIEENVFRNKLTFFAAAKVSSSFPPPEFPEIAFAGRSNVGKSSLLNSLTRQWGVVRTSDKPGLTQTINFFNLASKLCLVDLPGYGFAYAKEEVKDAWEELVKEYVSTRVGLKRVCLLIDTKWGMKPRDHELIELMERSQTKYQVVLTKTDMVFPINVARRAMQIEESLKTNKSVVNPVMMVSSKSGAGIQSLRSVLAKIVRYAK